MCLALRCSHICGRAHDDWRWRPARSCWEHWPCGCAWRGCSGRPRRRCKPCFDVSADARRPHSSPLCRRPRVQPQADHFYPFSPQRWACITWDGDVYDEDFADYALWSVLKPEAFPYPDGVQEVVAFGELPSRAELWDRSRAGRAEARRIFCESKSIEATTPQH